MSTRLPANSALGDTVGGSKNKGRMIPPPPTVRGLIGHFLRIADPPTVGYRASPPPVWSLTYFSLRAISEASDGGGGVWGGAGGSKSLTGGGGGGIGSGGKHRDGKGAKDGKAGAARGKMEAT